MKRYIFLILFALISVTLAAEVRLPHVMSDHAVIQRDRPARIWGWSAPKERITVRFHAQEISTSANEAGEWEVWLRPEAAGGPYTLTVSGNLSQQELHRSDLLVGDVWFASGQSNMEMPLKGFDAAQQVKDSAKEIAAANHPQMRLLIQKKRTDSLPQFDGDAEWVVCSPETVKPFSAVAYFFGRQVMQNEHVPVGLIDSTWGGTPAQSWISSEGTAWSNLPSVATDAGRIDRMAGRAVFLEKNLSEQNATLQKSGKPLQPRTHIPGYNYPSWLPSQLFNAMVSSFTKYTVRGFLWYQGETDHEGIKAANYSRVFPALIQDWRKQWGEGELPFLYVQISIRDTDDNWALVRDAQRRALGLTNTAMAVTLDLGLPYTAHFPDKQTVGNRLALAASSLVYGHTEKETFSPLFFQATAEDGSIRAWFEHADGLHSSVSDLSDFEVAAEDGKFVPATAKIEKIGDRYTIIASSASVPSPRYIRYGFKAIVKTFIYNGAGLPLGTFTSQSDAEFMEK